MHLFKRALQGTVIACFLLHTAFALAAGPTGEQEAIMALAKGRFPLALTKDGKNIIYVDRENRLHRGSIDNLKSESIALLPGQVMQISPSANGAQVAFVSSDYACVGMLDFTKNNLRGKMHNPAAQIRWISPMRKNGSKTPRNCQRRVSTYDEDRARFGNPFEWQVGGNSIALSSDGKQVAVGIADSSIQILDTQSGDKVLEIPTGGTKITKLRFVENDTKLFVVQADLGEAWEGPSSKSDMQFAVWDLNKRTLHNFHHTDTSGVLRGNDLLWDYSEETGALWAINTSGSYWDGKKEKTISPYLVDMKSCASLNKRQLSVPLGEGESWLEFLADPMGRWIAYSTPTTLSVRSSQTGKILARWDTELGLRSLVSSPDGLKIFAITGGIASGDEADYAPEIVEYSGGGDIKVFDLKPKLAGKGFESLRENLQVQAQAPCLIEDEKPAARDVAILTATSQLLWKLPINGTEVDWHLNRDGSLWLDRKTKIQKLDLESGKTILTLPTPRNEWVKSVPDFERLQFVNWESDTVSLRPFKEKFSNKDKRILVHRAGWTAERVVVMGEQYGVVWIDDQISFSADKDHPEGSALAIFYDVGGRELSVVKGVGHEGRGLFKNIIEDDGEDVFDFANARALPYGDYRWERSYGGSIRARNVNVSSTEEKQSSPNSGTTFWYGLHLSNDADPKRNGEHINTEGHQIVGLGGDFGARIGSDGVALFDAKKRQQIAFVAIQNVWRVSFDNLGRIVLIETGGQDSETHKLFAFKILE